MKKVLILSAFALIAFGCSRTQEVSNTANAPATNTAQTNAERQKPAAPPAKEETYTAGKDPRADLIAAAQKRQKLPFWSARVTVENMPQMNAEMYYVAPDRFQFKLPASEAIVIGNETFSNEEGVWVKEEEGAGENIREQITSGINEGAQNLKDVSIVGKEKINGQDANVYSYSAEGIMTKVWIATESGLELKNQIEMDSPETGKLKRTTVYDYVTPVKIEAPKTN
jgi:hypothetical protein